MNEGKYCGQQETKSGYDYVCTLRGDHDEHRAMDTQGNVIKAWPVETSESPQSGYTHCACRDCMDITVSSDTSRPELCSECTEAGCEPFAPDSADYNALPGHMRECQRTDAYSDDVADAGTGHGAYEYRSGN